MGTAGFGGSGGGCWAAGGAAGAGAPIGKTARGAVSGLLSPAGMGGGTPGFASMPASIARRSANVAI